MPLRFFCTDPHNPLPPDPELASIRRALEGIRQSAADSSRLAQSMALEATQARDGVKVELTALKAEATAARKEAAALRAQLDHAVKLLEGMAAAAAVPLPPPSLAPDENASPIVKPARTPRGKTAAAKDGVA